jgi:hypothetical protein
MKSHVEVAGPFNIFQSTPYYMLKGLNSSRPRDYIQFGALKDAVRAASCCPFDM